MYGAEYLSLEDLLDQDPSAYEFFQTLSPEAKALLEEDGSVTSFARLQSKTLRAGHGGACGPAVPGTGEASSRGHRGQSADPAVLRGLRLSGVRSTMARP